ncbi:hypothetical protein GFK26_00715 [Variovorax paradoxus]|uniref:Uncharacterized protein n=1 Tax=Variovorax paradoxus TaxID=34073 RepID=A0A5Q0LVW4_VARPD|nr:hypothetical protein [Variovorax paradoxus]QFZ81403.1 hypothetical protein GFK26_00715 [Variovorax paradoxus]
MKTNKLVATVALATLAISSAFAQTQVTPATPSNNTRAFAPGPAGAPSATAAGLGGLTPVQWGAVAGTGALMVALGSSNNGNGGGGFFVPGTGTTGTGTTGTR